MTAERLRVLAISDMDMFKKLLKAPTLGGIEVNHKSVVAGLRRRGHHVIEGGPVPRGWKADVVICPSYGPLALINVWLQKRKHGCACVQHAHTTTDDMKGGFLPGSLQPYVEMYLRTLYKFSEVLITPSNFSKAALHQLRLPTRPPIVPVSNGIDLNVFLPDNEKRRAFKTYLKERFAIDEVTPVILGVGVIWERKGIDVFHAAARALPGCAFVWVGSAVTAKEIVERYNNLPNLIFAGYVDDVVAAYCGSDVFFFPSRAENQGIPLLEAAACRLPIVCRNLPTYDWMEHEVHCLKGSTTRELIDMVRRVLPGKPLRDRLVDAAFENVKHHDIERVLDTVEGVYRRAIKIHQMLRASEKKGKSPPRPEEQRGVAHHE